MNRKYSKVIFIGIISLIWMGFTSLSYGYNSSADPEIKIIKGQLFYSEKGKDFESVTFRLAGLNLSDYSIAFVDINDKHGRNIGRIYDIYPLELSENNGSWYGVNLGDFKIKKEFTLEVHVLIESCWIPDKLRTISSAVTNIIEPIDPDETVLILKYP